MNKLTCVRCKKYIAGEIKVDTYRRRLGSKSLNQVDHYCEKCFYNLNMERSWNEYDKQKTALKKQNNK